MAEAKDVAAHAAELHQGAIVVDCHSDLLMSIADGRARLGVQVPIPNPEQWTTPFEQHKDSGPALPWPLGDRFGCVGQYSLPQLMAGGVTAQVCAVFVADHELDRALRRSMEMIWWFDREVNDNDDFDRITSVADIHRLKREGRCGGILALEGVEALGMDVRLLDIFHRLGVRIAGLSHNRRNAFADGTQPNVRAGGLSELGKAAVRRMNELGIVVDLAHTAPAGFWEILEISDAPVILSHGGALRWYPRRPEDSPHHPALDVTRGPERLEALARKGGVFGIYFLGQRDLDYVVSDIEYALEIMGPDHVGLGSDLYGAQLAHRGLEDISRVPAITERLVDRGHSDEVILKVLGGNFLRVFRQVWGG